MEAFEPMSVMDFQTILLKVEQSLNREDVEALVFLCADLLEKDVCCITTGRDLFTHLQELDFLAPERPFLLAELLRVSKRNGLLRQVGLHDLQTEGLVSSYRKLLFDLSENITAVNLKDIKFLLYQTLPRRKLEDDMTMLNLLLEMEKEDHLSETNLDMLEKIIGPVCPNLKRKINQYKEQNATMNRGYGYVQEHDHPCAHLFKQPDAPTEESSALSSQLSASVSLATPDASTEGVSLSEFSSSGKTDSPYSSVQSHNVFFTSSCEKMNHSAADTSLGKTQEIEAYVMHEGRTRGVCLIINNFDFSQSIYKNREGTDMDERCLVKVFQWLGFKTRTERDCSLEKIQSLLSQLSQEDHTNMDCLVCCVLSHGELGSVCGVDGLTLPVRDLTQPFSGMHCASLRDKPKLFFIQACQGKKEQLPVLIQSDGHGSTEPDLATDAVALQDTIPAEADFLLGMATVPEFASFRHRTEGSWFIQSLCENLVLLVPSGYDLLSILTKVNNHVSGKTARIDNKNKKQMPQPAFSLRKRVVFPVPKQPPPKLK
ncbi:caspase-8 isoform X1 [Conger conger]|uniref:caspase-8 isoform X1 n=2 Tax=Conger conger TaxID=82655 RepID=UPI002A5A0894|nr:caspase-8 isoform X1 [Conger conger]